MSQEKIVSIQRLCGFETVCPLQHHGVGFANRNYILRNGKVVIRALEGCENGLHPAHKVGRVPHLQHLRR